MKHPNCPRLREAGTARAFSLVELVLALGIFAFAIVAVLGLFPLALKGTSDTRSQTYITAVSGNLLAHLEIGEFHELHLYAEDGETVLATFDLGASTTLYLGFDNNGNLARVLTAGEFEQGVNDLRFIAELTSIPLAADDFDLPANASDPDVSHVTFSIEYPASAPAATREKEILATRIRA